jgi:hypothetical protein
MTTTGSSDVHLAVARGLLDHALDHAADQPGDVMVRFDLADAFQELSLPGRLPDITTPDPAMVARLPLPALLVRVRDELRAALDGITSGQDALHVARAATHLRHAQQLLAADRGPAA